MIGNSETLLDDEQPMMMSVTLAARIGCRKALILERIWGLQFDVDSTRLRTIDGRVFLLHPLSDGITEAGRGATTILLPDEY